MSDPTSRAALAVVAAAPAAAAQKPVSDLLASVAGQLEDLGDSLRGVEDAVGVLSDAAPAQAARLRDLQNLDRAIQTVEALSAFLRDISEQGDGLGAAACDEALARVRLETVAAALSGRVAPAADPGFELL